VPIHGTIEEAGLPDVLQLLTLGRKTGCLSVSDGTQHGEIYLDGGRVTYASVANRDRIGEMLVKSGRISRTDLEAATAEQAKGVTRPLGRILVDSGRIDRVEIERFVRRQVEEAVYYLFTWRKGAFAFESARRPSHGALLVSLDPEALLLEGARQVDEWSLIEKKIPSFEMVFQRTRGRRSGGANDALTEDQRRILPLLDGTRDVAGIVDGTGMSEFDAGKALYGLIMAGFVKLVERRNGVRHLDYRELLAYVVREAEFGNAERRKQAARHIVDCPSCSERLRTIHVRKTGAAAALPELEADSGVPPEYDVDDLGLAQAEAPFVPPMATPFVPPPEVTFTPPAPAIVDEAPVDEAPPIVERRTAEERRAAEERRQGDRRHGDRRRADRRAGGDRRQGDRRQQVNPAYARSHPDRRHSERRVSDRRDYPRERRSGDGARRPSTTVVTTPIDRVPGPGDRMTVPRQLPVTETETAEAVRPAAGPVGVTIAVSPAAPPAITQEIALDPAPPEPPAAVSPLAGLITEMDLEPPVPAPAATAAPAEKKEEKKERTQDLIWLQSPQESMEMIRASRSTLPKSDVEPRVIPRAPSSANPAPPTVRASAVIEDAVPAQTTERRVAQPVRAPRAAGPTAPPPRLPGQIVISVRQLAIAAGITGVALLGYAVGHMGRATGAHPSEHAATDTPSVTSPAMGQPASRLRSYSPGGSSAGNHAAVRVNVIGAPPSTAARPTGAASQGLARTTPEPHSNVTQLAAAAPAPAPTPAAPASDAQTTPAASAPTPAPAPAAAAPAQPAAPAPITLQSASASGGPDAELATGGWQPIERADAAALMGGTLGVIPGLGLESITRSTTGSRPRVRVAQVAPGGERIVLTETRSGAAVRPGPAVITALRVMPASEAYPFSTGTVSFGAILITAKSSVSADALHGHLEKLVEAQ